MTEEEEEVDNIHFYKTKDEFDIQGNIYGNRIIGSEIQKRLRSIPFRRNHP